MQRTRSIARIVALSLLGGLLSALLALVPWKLSPASAAEILSPDAPRPVNVLPSTVAHLGRTTGVAAPKAAQAMTFFLYNAMQTPEFWKAAQAQKAGQALTVAQNNVITTVQKNTRIPAGPISALARGGAQMVVIEAGLMMGGGAVDLFWPDRQGIVCANTGTDPLGELTAWAARADCADKRLVPDPEFVPNLGIKQGLTAVLCGFSGYPSSACLNLTEIVKGVQAVNGADSTTFCFIASGFSGTSYPTFRAQYANGTMSTGLGVSPTSASHAWNSAKYCFSVGSNAATLSGIPTTQVTAAGGVVGIAQNVTSPTPQQQDTIETVPANPTRTMRCVILGSNGTTYNGQALPYTEQDDSYPTPTCPDLPEGVIPQESWIETVNGSETGRLWQQTTAPEVVTAHNAYPLCRDQLCATELHKGDVNCHVAPAGCVNWFEDPNKSATYQCKYGPYAVTLGECTIYADGFRTAPGSSTISNPDRLSDPETGAPLESPFPSGRDAQTFDNPVQQPETSRQCMPTGWGVFNPIEWVLRPVQCALEWAFVPRTAVMLDVAARITTHWQTTPPAKIGAFVEELSEDVPTLDGCEGPPLNMDLHLGEMNLVYNGYPLSACEAPMSEMATLARTIGALAMFWSATVAISRYLGATMNFPEFGKS